MTPVRAFFYTDPACPWSWAAEPAVRKLAVEFPDGIDLRPVMSGMAREFGAPLALVREWLEAAAASDMPVDPRLWVEAPPRSSYPAGMAVKAAGEQGPDVEARYLRVLRQGFACERRKLDGAEPLLDAARTVEGLDLERMRVDLESHAILELFGADLDRALEAAERAGLEKRPELPTIEFEGTDAGLHAVRGSAPYERYREAALAAGASPRAGGAPSVEEALRRFGTMAAAEVAAVCDVPLARAHAELWRLAGEWRVRFERRLTGEMWSVG